MYRILNHNHMKWYNSFKRSDGTYTTQEWSAEDMVNYDIMSLVVICVVGSILTVLSSAVCLIARLYDYEENEKAPSFWGIFFALYFIIDYWRGWAVTFILGIFEDAATIKIIALWNLAMLITHILLLIFGDTIYFNIKAERDRKSILVIFTILALGISYLIATSIIK